MLEHCEICQQYAPCWDDTDYLEWHVAVTAAGLALGVVCPGCFVYEEHAFIGRVEDDERPNSVTRLPLRSRKETARTLHQPQLAAA